VKATVLVPTFRRPDSLRAALQSIAAQRDLSLIQRVIVVDNDPQASATDVVRTFIKTAPFPVVLVHAPVPGVANARNAGVAAAQDAEFIAFLDDDETASPDWLSGLLRTQATTAADVVFGPIRGQAPSAPAAQRAFIEEFFSRKGPTSSVVIDRSYGCGNSLMRVSTALSSPVPFAVEANETGGEDDMLFARLSAQGAVYAWAADAWVDEHAPTHRATLNYVMKRAFAYGQGPSQTSAQQGQPFAVARWMAIGVAQLIFHGSMGLMMWITRRSSAYAQFRKAIEGLGKLLWFKNLELRLYGQAELDRRT